MGLVFLAPLFFLPFGTYPVFLNKQAFVAVFLFAAAVLYVWRVIASGNFSYRTGVLWGYGFLLFSILGFVLAPARLVSWWGISGGEVDSVLNIFSFFLFFFLIANALSGEYVRHVAWSYGAGVAVLLVLALLQFFGIFLPFEFAQANDFTPLGGTLGLALVFGATVLLAAGMLVHNTLSRFQKIGLIALASGSMLYLVLLDSAAKIVWALLAAGLIVLLISYLYNLSKQGNSAEERRISFRVHGGVINTLLAILAVAIFFSLVSLPLSRVSSTLSPRMPHGEVEETLRSSAENARILKGAWGVGDFSWGALKRIVFGAGPSQYGYEYLRYRGLPPQNQPPLRPGQGYSLLGTYLVTLGALGTLFFLAFLGTILSRSLRVLGDAGNSGSKLLRILFPVLVYGCISFFFVVPGYAALILFFGALGLAAREVLPRREVSIFAKPQYVVVVSPLAIIILVGVIVGSYTQISRAVASGYYAEGVRAVQGGDLSAGLSNIETAISWDHRTAEYYRGALEVFVASLRDGDAEDAPVARAIAAGERAVAFNSREPEYYLVLARVYEILLGRTLVSGELGKTGEQAYMSARQAHETALALDPQDRSTYERLAILHSAAGREAETEEVLKKLLGKDPNYARAHYLGAELALGRENLGLALIHAGHLKEQIPGDPGLLFELGLLYYNNERLEEAEKEFLGALALLPEYSNARYYLGLIYDKQNKRAKALEQFEAVQKLNPDNKDVAAIVENLRKGKPAITTSK